MPLLEANLNGRTIRLLGVTRPITPAVNGINYPIFTVGDVKNRAPESSTFVAFVVISYDAGPGSSLTLRLGDAATIATAGDWKNTFDADTYTNPSVIYAADGQGTYENGVGFAVRVVANSGGVVDSMVVKAYGWTE